MYMIKLLIFLFAITLYSQPYEKIIELNAKKFNIDKNLIKAIITVESRWNEKAAGENNCNGLMQVKGGSFEPGKNVMQGCSKLRSAMNFYNNHFSMSLTAYNRGNHGAKTYLKKKHSGCSRYARKVLKVYRELTIKEYREKKIKKNLGIYNKGIYD
jgi:soluble lytic murein transglycosylase-like protein